jgi:hypothetical protein
MHIPAIMNRRMIVIKFQGTYEGLQNQSAFTGIGGIWRDFGNQKQRGEHGRRIELVAIH